MIRYGNVTMKLAKIPKCRKSLRLIDDILSDRKLKFHLNWKRRKNKFLQNGLSQGSVLSSSLFNDYTADIVHTLSRKFMYVVDVGFVAQVEFLEKLVDVLNNEIISV